MPQDQPNSTPAPIGQEATIEETKEVEGAAQVVDDNDHEENKEVTSD